MYLSGLFWGILNHFSSCFKFRAGFLFSFDLAHIFLLPYVLFEGLTLTRTRKLVLTAGFTEEGKTVAHDECK